MDGNLEKFLKPIREIIENLNEETSAKKLKSLIEKDKFYEAHIGYLLVEKLQDKRFVCIATNIKCAFKILNFIKERSQNLTNLLIKLYNFLIKNLDYLNNEGVMLDEIFEFCKLEKAQENKDNLKIYILLNNLLCIKNIPSNTRSKQDIFHSNLRYLLKSMRDDDDLQFKFFENVRQRIAIYVNADGNFERVNEYLTEGVIKGLKEAMNLRISSSKVWDIYVKLLAMFVDNYSNPTVIENSVELMKAMHNVLSNEQYAECNKIILYCSKLSGAGKCIVSSDLKTLYKTHFRNAEKTPAIAQSECYQRTVVLIMKMLFLNTDKFDKNIDCVLAFHELVTSFLHILKNIKFESSLVCCSDLKRHEIFNLTCASIKLMSQLPTNVLSSSKALSLIDYYVRYGKTIYCSLKCDAKSTREFVSYLKALFFFLYKFHDEKAAIVPNIKIIGLVQQHFLVMQKESKFPENVAWNLIAFFNTIYESASVENDKAVAAITIDGLSHLLMLKRDYMDNMSNSKDKITERSLMRTMNVIRSVAKTLGFANASDCLKHWGQKQENSEWKEFLATNEILILELATLNRYNETNISEYTEIFRKICENLKDIREFVRACHSINDKVLQNIDLEKFGKLNARLEKETVGSKDVAALRALMYNNYYLFYLEESESLNRIVENYKDKIIPDCHNLQRELKLVKFMNKSLEYCEKIICCIEKDPSLCALESFSKRQFLAIVENLSMNYFMRGIEYKDIEARTLMWKFLVIDPQHLQQYPEKILETATFFIDNYSKMIDSSGNYIKISKNRTSLKIEDILAVTNQVVDTFTGNFDNHSEFSQIVVLSYLLSLWHFKMLVVKRKNDGLALWYKFHDLWTSSKVVNDSAFNSPLEAKINFIFAEIYMSLCKRSAVDLLIEAVVKIFQIQKIPFEMNSIYHQINRNVLTKILNISLNRLLDMEQYLPSIQFLKERSITKGYFIKTLEYMSMLTLFKLNMEKIEDAKNELSAMSKLMQYDSEISVEVPLKLQQEVDVMNVGYELARRDASMAHSHQPMLISNSSDEVNVKEQLNGFIHELTCSCEFCKYPSLKCMLFQIGCHYSRLFWLLGKYDISKSFNESALEPWRFFWSKLQRSSSKCAELFSVNKAEFVNSSIRWLFQVADTYVRLKEFDEAEEIYTEIELLCTNNIFDYDCIKQGLFGRKENLEFLMKNEDEMKRNESISELNYAEFLKVREKSKKSTENDTEKLVKIVRREATKKKTETASTSSTSKPEKHEKKLSPPATSSISSKTTKPPLKKIDSVIYIDSDESFKTEEPPKIKKKDKLKTPATTRVTKKSADKASKEKSTEVVDLTDDKPKVARVRRRMI